MKILVMSDSHASLQFMRHCVNTFKPSAIIHLGDHYDDGAVIQEENPQLPFVQVPGNCDRYRCPFGAPEVVKCSYEGVVFFLTHGHNHHVKHGVGAVLADARRAGAQVVLYGHTHVADCHREEDGLWVINPGSCRGRDGSVALVEIEAGQVSARIVRSSEAC